MECIKWVPDAEPDRNACPLGKPIYPETGEEVLVETDYASPVSSLNFTRTYRSTNGYFASVINSGWVGDTVSGHESPACVPGSFTVWDKTYESCSPFVSTGNQEHRLVGSDGRITVFNGPPGAITAKADVNLKVTQRKNASGGIEWLVQNEDGSIAIYNSRGALIRQTKPDGRVELVYDYSDSTTSAAVAPRPGLLIRVTDQFGRQLNFHYDAGAHMVQMTDPAGGVFHYAYDSAGNLISVTYPDGKTKTYLYNEPANTANTDQPHALTGIIDENGARYATINYDASGKGISTELAGGADKFQFKYGYDGNSTTVTGPLGSAHTYGFKTVLGTIRPTSVSQPGGSGCLGATSQRTYDANGNVASRLDFNGNRSCFAHDPSRNLETTRIEGIAPGGSCPANLAGYTPKANSAERKITTVWHPRLRLPVRIDEAGRTTLLSYDGKGKLLGKTIQDTATGQKRTWTYSYNAKGQLLTENGPRTDVRDITTYLYDKVTGNLLAMRNAKGHETRYGDYDAHGRPRRITDPNGKVVTLTHDPRGRLTSTTDNGQTTRYTYDGVGQLIKLDLPNGAFYNYAYDPAHRLTDIADAVGNHRHYTLDNAGNRIQEDTFDAANTLTRTHRRTFDALSRLAQDIGAYNQPTTYQYDANGNLRRVTDPNQHTTTYDYDARNRLISQTDALSNPTVYRYDVLDRLISVTDSNQQTTDYSYDALDNLIRQTSPNTGTTTFGYDTAGNLTRKLDARKAQTSFSYDALDRLLKVDYPGTADDVAYAYDHFSATDAGIGRLYKAGNGAAALVFGYDKWGRSNLTSVAIPGVAASASTRYHYDPAGMLSGLTYPSGRVVNYSRDAAGQINAINLTVGGQTINLATGLAYWPFGAWSSMSLGNGIGVNRSYDLDERLSRQTIDTLHDLELGYDLTGNLAGIIDRTDPINRQDFAYDPLDRLLSASGAYGAWAWTYDAVGNRTAEYRDGTPTHYDYLLSDQKLQHIRGIEQKSFAYDANGNTIQSGDLSLRYGTDNRLHQVSRASSLLADYYYDGFGRRVSKYAGGLKTYYQYDLSGKLLSETDARGKVMAEYVYLDGIPFATINATGINYLHTNHLGAPVAATDTAGKMVWKADYRPFGSVALTNPSISLNLRFPGQYHDEETGLYYNMARYYDPAIGRYLQSDPIGLAGGINTYLYANGNPLSYVDPDGHNPFLWPFLRIALEIWSFTTAIQEGMPPGPGGIGGLGAKAAGEMCVNKTGTEIVQRWMSKAELKATQQTGLLRGGRGGTHYVTDAANSSADRARQRLALPVRPEVRVTLEVPAGRFSSPSRIEPLELPGGGTLPGGGLERTATGEVPVQILGVHGQ